MYELASVRFPLNEHVCVCVCVCVDLFMLRTCYGETGVMDFDHNGPTNYWVRVSL